MSKARVGFPIWRRRAIRGLILVGMVACHGDGATSSSTGPLLVSSAPLPSANVLSAAWIVKTRHADSVALAFGPAGGSLHSLTPATRAAGDSAVVAVLGLLPSTRYSARFVLYSEERAVPATPLEFETAALPADLPTYTAQGSSPSPGFVVFGAGQYGLVIDNTGRIVWYHRFAEGPGLAFMPTANGTYATQPPTGDPGAAGPWLEIDVLGRVLRSMPCAGGLVPRLHDIIVQPDGSYWLMCDEVRAIDLTARGGPTDALVIGTQVQHVDRDGSLRFSWSAFDHVDHDTIDPSLTVGERVTWTHGNAIALDGDGHLLVSMRNLSQVIKVHTATGAIVWRLGGEASDYSFSPAVSRPFFRQHGIRVCDDGELVLLDNLGESGTSRVERYRLDPILRTAVLTGSAVPDPPRIGLLGGSVQPLPGNRILASFGNGGYVAEFDAGGAVAWRLAGDPGYVFRAERIASLYAPGTR
jgi:hypothetical protein